MLVASHVEAYDRTWGMSLRLTTTLTLAFWLVAVRGAAAEIGPEGGLLSVDVHAFVGQGFILTTSNDYLAPDTKHGSFQLSDVGINFTKGVTDKLRLGVQFFAQDFGSAGNYTARVDWAYVDYRWQDWLGFRAGRLKIPFGFYNEVNDIDAARVPILLPQSVYPLQTRSFLFAQTGTELYGFARARPVGAVDYRLYGGTIFLDPAIAIPPGSTVQLQLNVPYVVGGRLLWETPLDGLRFAGSLQALHLDTTAFIPNTMPIGIRNQSLLWVLSADYSFHDFAVTAEYSRWHTKQDSALPSSNFTNLSERGYAMVSYRETTWLQTGAYYSIFFPDVHNREGRANRQHDVAVTVRFDINTHWLVKLEGHYMAGTAGLGSPVRVDPQPLSQLDRYWGVFLAKTTAYF
jgi:hypothetical protein